MPGTLNGAPEVRGITLEPDAVTAMAEGVNEVQDRLPVLTRIVVHYMLRIPAGSREAVDRALATHRDQCPMAATLHGAVDVTRTADIEQP
jgi:organic hydroperoxide reductase OsmC/OhrA